MPYIKKEVKDVLPEAYLPFAGYVIMTRALPDSRDCLKSGARFCLWKQYEMKNISKNNRMKATDVMGQVLQYNPHGPASVFGTLVRMGKPFAMRYPTEDFKGNVGTMSKGKDHAADRYLEVRANKVSDEFFQLIPKETVVRWRDNYNNSRQYPEAFPTTFPNFVNGNTGIGVGCMSSIPQFNLVEVLNACEKLVKNPRAPYNDIYCPPDFATGAIIVNGDRVKEVLEYGGKKEDDEKNTSIVMRAAIEYNEKDRELIISQMPYQVFAVQVLEQIAEGIENGKLSGIHLARDSVGRDKSKIITVELTKTAKPAKVCELLYKHTSLQSSYPISCLMLHQGKQPMQFGLREMMLEYVNHMTMSIRRAYEFDLRKVRARINILEGLLIAIAHIEEIVELIKTASDVATAKKNLIERFGFNEDQVLAILDMKLQRLVNLEGVKIENELKEKRAAELDLSDILANDQRFEDIIIGEMRRVKNAFGDERRTKILNLSFNEDEEEEPVEEKQMVVYLTNLNYLYAFEDSTLIAQRRGGVGTKIKLEEGEYIQQTITDTNHNNLLVFSNKGKVYNIVLDKLEFNQKTHLSTMLELEDGELISTLISDEGKQESNYLMFVTEQGMVKKTQLKEYRIKKNSGVSAIKLKDDDMIKDVFLIKSGDILGIGTNNGMFVMFDCEDVNDTGRNTMGVKGITLKVGDSVASATIINSQTDALMSVTQEGYIKNTNLSEYTKGSRANKGVINHKLNDGDRVMAVCAVNRNSKEVIISSTTSVIKFSIEDVTTTGRAAIGTQSIKLKSTQKVKGMVIA